MYIFCLETCSSSIINLVVRTYWRLTGQLGCKSLRTFNGEADSKQLTEMAHTYNCWLLFFNLGFSSKAKSTECLTKSDLTFQFKTSLIYINQFKICSKQLLLNLMVDDNMASCTKRPFLLYIIMHFLAFQHPTLPLPCNKTYRLGDCPSGTKLNHSRFENRFSTLKYYFCA